MLLFRNRRYKTRLEHVWLSKRETKISLKRKKIEEINFSTFIGNRTLKEIILPDTLIRIMRGGAFYDCSNLEKVTFNDGLRSIEDDSFGYCKSLKQIELPDSLIHLGSYSFCCCDNLEKVKFSKNLDEIGDHVFYNCKSLKEVVIHNNMKKINKNAFSDCSSLETIILPSSLNYVHKDAFDRCYMVNKVVIEDYRIILNRNIKLKINDKLKYIYLNEQTNELIVTSDKCNLENHKEFIIKGKYSDEETLNYKIIKEILFSKYEIKDIRINNIANDFIRYNLSSYNCDNVKKHILNYDKFIKMLKYIDKSLYNRKTNCRIAYSEYDIFKFAYALGAFNDNPIDRQKACEFIKVLYDKKLIYIDELHASFESMKVNAYNKEFAEFIMNKDNFERLKWYERRQYGFISRIYNSFDDIKEFGRSNRGNQRYRKVTVDMCVEYFESARFKGVNEYNLDIVETIKHYTRNQESFDLAAEIRNEFIELKIEDKIEEHILKEELKEIREEILSDVNNVTQDLNCISNNKFTYEYLSKYDPKNFVLGKYCSCCAHLEGVGDGIMKASIIHPDCQNLIIKDENDKVIAKSTLYVNRKQGYVVFNNVEVNNNISSEDKELIYIKYIKAVKDFAKRYNEINSDNQIKQINVGMNLNDLRDQITKNNKRAINLLKGIDFSYYGDYSGDWQDEQYILFKSK